MSSLPPRARSESRPSPGVPRWLAALALLAALGGPAGCGKYARVEGTVVPPESATAGDEHVESTIVWVESKLRHPGRTPGMIEIRLTEAGFEPAWCSIPVGTRLVLRNDSGVFHTPFSPDPNGGFRLDPVRPGQTTELTLTRPGELQLFCELHSEATAVVMVLPVGEYAEVSEAGHFRFSSLPSGSHLLSYWHPVWGSGQRRVEIPQHGYVQVELRF